MSDWRYHIASLSAVLLSLAIGLMLGAVFISPGVSPALTQGLKQMEKRLDERLTQERKELDQATTTIESLNLALERSQHLYERLAKHMPPHLLDGYRVALIQTGDQDDLANDVQSSLESAGAEVISTTTIRWHEVRAEELSVIVKNLADVLSQGGNEASIEVLRRRDGLSLHGDYRLPCRRAVIIGGFSDKGQQEPLSDRILASERALLEAMQAAKMKLDACEPYHCEVSLVDLYRRYGIPHVDCADLPIGRLILPFLLLEEQGRYGLKQTADAISPESLWQRLGLP